MTYEPSAGARGRTSHDGEDAVRNQQLRAGVVLRQETCQLGIECLHLLGSQGAADPGTRADATAPW